MTTISPSLRVIQGHAAVDGKLSPQEFKELQTQFHKDNPTASTDDFKNYMLELLRGDKDSTSQQLNALFNQAASGATVSFGFDDPEPVAVNFDFSVKGAQVTDSDGIHTASQGDLSGKIDSVSGKVDLFGDRLNSALRQSLNEMVETGIRWGENPDDTDSENGFVRFFENIWEGGRDAVQSAAAAGTRAAFSAVINGSSVELTAGNAPGGQEAIDLNVKTPVMDGKIQIYSDNQGGLVLDTPFKAPESKDIWDSIGNALDVKTQAYNAVGNYATQSALSYIQDQLKALGVKTKVKNENGKYTFVPQEMTLTAAQFQQLTGQPLPAEYANGQITLKPENIKLSIEGGQLKFEVQNLNIAGSSDTTAAPATVGEQPAAELRIDQADVKGGVSADGSLTPTEISDLKGSLSGETNLSPETLNQIKEQISQIVSKIDEQLKTYGLSREQLTQMISQLPNDLLQQLLSSNNKSDIMSAAKTLGIDAGQLENALSFLKEQPYQQLLNDVSRLSAMIEENTQIKGKIDFQLQQLKMGGADSDFLATLKGLKVDASLTSTTPQGVQSDATIKADVDNATVTPDAVDTGKVKVEAELTVEHPPADPQAQIDLFRDALSQPGPNDFVKEDGYLRDEGPDKIRKGNGLTAKTAQEILRKLDNATLLRMKDMSDDEIKAMAQQLGVDEPDYLRYVVRYIDRYVNTASQPKRSQLTAEVNVDSSHLQAGNTDVKGINANAELTTGTPVDPNVLLDRFKTTLSQPAPNDFVKADRYLKDEGDGKIRSGKGLTARTAQELLSKVDNATLLRLKGQSEAQIDAEAQQLGIDPKYLRYMVRYVDKYVLSQAADSTLKADLTAGRLQTDGQTASVTGPKLQVDAHVNGGTAPDTDVRVDLQARDAVASENGLTLNGVQTEASLDSDTDARVKAESERITGNAERLAAENGSISEFEFANGQTRISGSASDVDAAAENGKVDLSADLNWTIDNKAAGSHTQLQGVTELEIRANELFQARTKNIHGEIEVSTREFLEMCRSAGLNDFVNSLQKDGTVLSDKIMIKVEPHTGFDYSKAGTTRYQISARLPGISTKYGQASLSFKTQQDGRITGNMSLSPNQHLAGLITDAIKANGVDVRGTTFDEGKIKTAVEHALVSGTVLNTSLKGDTVEIEVSGAKLLWIFEANGLTRDQALKALQEFGASAVGETKIQIPLKSLASKVLDPETASRLQLQAQMDANNRIRLDFQYQG